MHDLLMMAAVAAHGPAHAAAEHVDPSIAGIFNATVIVSLAMLVLVGIAIWQKVPAMIAGALDSRIAEIRKQLDEATQLRKEAEALRGEYQAKLVALDGEAAEMRIRAENEAAHLIAKAEEDAVALVARRQRMAEDRIGAAERSAIADVRATAARVAVAAAQSVIAETHGAANDRPLIDKAIADLGQL